VKAFLDLGLPIKKYNLPGFSSYDLTEIRNNPKD
jgi:hypothetical protein